jgi:hypothetical protein
MAVELPGFDCAHGHYCHREARERWQFVAPPAVKQPATGLSVTTIPAFCGA